VEGRISIRTYQGERSDLDPHKGERSYPDSNQNNMVWANVFADPDHFYCADPLL